MNNSTIADSLSPAELEEFGQFFELDLDHDISYADEFITEEWLEATHGVVTASHLWDAMWRFGIVVDDEKFQRLGSYWRDPEGLVNSGYFVPDDYDTEVSLIDLDHPPMEDVAWDAKGIAA